KDIGMIFQNFNLLNSKTVFHNIAIPLILQGRDKAFIQARVAEFLQRDNGARALRLEFVGATAQQPIINHLIREYAVEVNILFAS
ncbi:hypothetical protein J8805_29150, partial [Klebsiella pneumoniae]